MTDEIPDRRCAVEGCESRAVARLFERDSVAGLRCRDCLGTDLGLRDTRHSND